MKCVVYRNTGGGETVEMPGNAQRAAGGFRSAFTLLEVMIAGGILFICLFAILSLVSNALRNAAILRHQRVDASMAAALLTVQLGTTNQVSEGSGSGDFGDFYPGYRYDWKLTQIATNGLCELDIVVHSQNRGQPLESQLTTLLFLPNLQQNGRF